MRKILFVDCCMRGELSRTRQLQEAFYACIKGEKTRLVLDGLPLLPLSGDTLQKRQDKLDNGEYGDTMFDLSHQFAEADMVVISAPFWDMGIPSRLKTYFELVSVSGIAFDDACKGICKAQDMVYLTTRGMEIEDGSFMEQASPYLKALCAFFGIARFHMISAWGLDMVPAEEVTVRLKAACSAAQDLARSL